MSTRHINDCTPVEQDANLGPSNRQWRFVPALAVGVTLFAGGVLPTTGWGEDNALSNQSQMQATGNAPQENAVKNSPETEVENFTAYQGVYMDPDTGEFGPPPADQTGIIPLDLSTIEQNLSTSSEGLKEKTAPGGGRMIRLNGRFQDAMILTIDASEAPTTSSSISDPVVQDSSDVTVIPTEEEK